MADPNLLIAIISLFVSIASLYATYYFFNKGLKVKKPLFTVESLSIFNNISKSFPGFQMLFNGIEVSSFTVSRVAIWNAGKETIFLKDISENDKIVVKPEEGYQIFKAEIIKAINSSNNFTANLENGIVKINFDYLDYQEGASVEIYHTGKSSWSLKVEGSIIGFGKIEHAKHIPYPKRNLYAKIIAFSIFLVSTAISFLFVGIKKFEIILAVNTFIAFFAYAILPLLITLKYTASIKTSSFLGVNDDDERLRAPDFPPTGRLRERDKDADPY